MRDFGVLVLNEARLQYFEMKQYWFETVGGLAFMCAMFVGLFYGIESFTAAGEQEGSLDGLVFGFILWSFAVTAYNSITRTIIEDTQKGYIEQLFLCPGGFKSVLFAKSVVDLLYSILFVTLTAYLVMWLTGNWIDINFAKFYLIMMMAAPSLIGLGFIMCGLTLVFKRIGTVSAIMTFALMAIVAVDALPFNLYTLLPFTAGNSLARDVILQGAPMATLDVAIVLINSAVYMAIGLTVFHVFERIARRKNLIGQY